MKRFLSSVVFLALVLSCGPVFGQAGANGEEAGTEVPPKVRAKSGTPRADANEIRRYQERLKKRDGERSSELRQRRMRDREKIRKMRREKQKELETAGDANQPSRKGAKDIDREQRLKMIEQQMSQEEAKHLKRVARMARIRELAGDDSKVVVRLDKLMQKEQSRYEQKRRNFDRIKRRMSGENIRPSDRRPLDRDARDAMRRPGRRPGGPRRPRPEPADVNDK